MDAKTVTKQLEELSTPERAKGASRFFKTAPGQYGEGDIFMGIKVPELRKIARQYVAMSLQEATLLLTSPLHECRETALFILVLKYAKGTPKERREIYDVYMTHTKYINNWDLVDASAEYIVGPELGKNYKKQLSTLAKSKSIWERRIAMLACFYHIKAGDPEPAFYIIEFLKQDKEDLIQKAVGWMLREIGKRCSKDILRSWLLKNDEYKTLPRTTLRYAIEHFETEERKAFLQGSL